MFLLSSKEPGLELGSLTDVMTVGSIRLSMICLFGALALRQLAQPVVNSDSGGPIKESGKLIGAKHLWLLGSLFSLIHALAAITFHHHGSHELAFEDTARQTQELIGIRLGAGIYFNYAFVLIWICDAMWWAAHPGSYLARSNWLTGLIYGFLIFIAINGTIVFETGWTRWISIIAIGWLLIMAFRTRANSNRTSPQ